MLLLEIEKRSTVIQAVFMLFFIIGTVLVFPPYVQADTSTRVLKEKHLIAPGTIYETELYLLKSNIKGPVVLVVGGVHGSEIAGVKAAHRIKDLHITKGTLIVIPEANKRAVNIRERFVPGEWDLNRTFPTSSKQKPSNQLSKELYSVISTYEVDWLLDLHEGLNYCKVSNSVGQSVIYYPGNGTEKYAESIAAVLNKSITSSKKKFSILRIPVAGSLARSTAQYKNVNSIIIETCMKDYTELRIGYHVKAVTTVLNKLKML